MTDDLRHIFGVLCVCAAGMLGLVMLFDAATDPGRFLADCWGLLILWCVLTAIGLRNLNRADV